MLTNKTGVSAEEVPLAPVYTDRAFGGLPDLIRRGDFQPDEQVPFWHIGGIRGLSAHKGQLI